MDWWLILSIALGGLIVLLCLGVPVAIAFLTLDVIGFLVLLGPRGLGLITSSIFESVGSITFGAVPIFYLLGEILFESKAVDILLDAVDKWVGRLRARLNIVAIGVGTALGALSGSYMADAAVLGSTLLPEMRQRGYDTKLSLGTIVCAGSLGAIIPPSVLAVLIGVLADVSISKLLISGVMPGLLLASLFVIYVLIRVKISPHLAPAYAVSDVPLSEKILALIKTLPFCIIILLVLGLIFLGIATPTESAATGAVGAMIVAGIYGRLDLEVIKKSCNATLKLTGMIFFIFAGSKAFSQLLALSGATRGLLDAIVGLDVHPMMMFAIMQFIILLLGCFLDQNSIMMIAIPIYNPVIAAFQFDPLWFWLIFLINMTVGGITPPFGLVLFVMKGVAPDIPMSDIYKGALPFVLLIIFGMIIISIFPGIALWLPNLFLS